VLLARGLPIVTDGVGLVWLVEGFKPEEINAPVEEAADSGLPVGLHVVITRLCGTCVRTPCAWLASLAVHEVDLV